MNGLLLVALGIIAGTFSGLFGIGGGTILIPGLVFLAGLSQHEAQGTTLAIMLLPIGLLAVIPYYRSGHIHLYITALVVTGFLVGGFIGASMAVGMPVLALRRAFGVFLFFVSLYTIFAKK
jgi:uncharacterized membrane protein YfcA